MEKLAAVLGHRLMIDSVEIATALTDNSYCQHWGYDTCTIAALFVPNTYEVYWNTTLDHLMERMVKEHDFFWNQDRLTKAKTAGLTPNEVCTLASIIDEETANTAEKPMIAGMYINRLHTDMYNTYRNTGLPPGPIKIASIKGIEAVLNYVKHDFLYMCAKEDFSGTHNFAVTYNEHLRNAARYAAALNRRGIK